MLEEEFFQLLAKLDYYYYSPDYSDIPAILRLQTKPWNSDDANIQNLWKEIASKKYSALLKRLSTSDKYNKTALQIFKMAYNESLK